MACCFTFKYFIIWFLLHFALLYQTVLAWLRSGLSGAGGTKSGFKAFSVLTWISFQFTDLAKYGLTLDQESLKLMLIFKCTTFDKNLVILFYSNTLTKSAS